MYFQPTIHAQRFVCMTVSPRKLDTWGKLPPSLALLAVLGLVRPHTIKLFLPSILSWRHSHEKRYQALSCFSVLTATESWAGPRNETTKQLHLSMYEQLIAGIIACNEQFVSYYGFACSKVHSESLLNICLIFGRVLRLCLPKKLDTVCLVFIYICLHSCACICVCTFAAVSLPP